MRRRAVGWVAPDVSKGRVILRNICNCSSNYGVSYSKTSTAGICLLTCVVKWLGPSRNVHQRTTVIKWSLYVPPSLTFTNSTFCPHSCIYVFCVDLRTNSDYVLYSINWLVFITELECVYCAVRSSYFLGAFVELQNATISVVMFVRPSVWNNSTPNWRIFIKFDVWVNFTNLRRKLKFN
jgi:hypothetical protein